MTRETRKIQKVGGSTYSVSLPKSWARARDLEAGSLVTVVAHPDDVLVVEPGEGDETTERTVTVAHDDPERLEALVRAAYAAGFDQLRIEATETLTRAQRRAVGRVTEALPGTAVVEERETRMVVRVLLDGEEVSVAQSVRQLAFVATSMHREALAALVGEGAPDAVDRDAEPDRLVALVDRHFHRGLSRVVTLDALGSSRPELAELRGAARELQAVAADARRLADLAAELDAAGADTVAELPTDLRELGERACEILELATVALAGDAGAEAASGALAGDAGAEHGSTAQAGGAGAEAASAALARREELRGTLAEAERVLLADGGEYWQARAVEHCRRTADRGGAIARLALRNALRRGELEAAPLTAADPADAGGFLDGSAAGGGAPVATGDSADRIDPLDGDLADGGAGKDASDAAPDADS